MILKDSIYNVLKWVVIIFLPAFAVLYGALGPVWGWPEPEKVVYTISAVETFLGALIGVSTYAYNKKEANNEPITDSEQTSD